MLNIAAVVVLMGRIKSRHTGQTGKLAGMQRNLNTKQAGLCGARLFLETTAFV